MKRIAYSLFGLVMFLILFSPLNLASAQVAGESVEKNQLSQPFNLPKISKERVDKIKEAIKKSNLKAVKEYTPTEKNKINNFDPYTTISSQGEIVNSKDSAKSNSFLNPIESSKQSSRDSISALATDNRVRITDTTVSPYNSIAQIDFYDASTGNGYTCSGTFINQETVLTAAHCVYDSYNNRYYSGWHVYPGENGTDLPYHAFPATNAYVSSVWMNSSPPDSGRIYYSDVQNDFAVLKLAGSSHPYSQSVSSASAVGDSITSIGYPADHSIIHNGYYYYYMYRSAGKIDKIDSGAITHSAYVTGGMSGGPIRKSSSIISVNSTASWAPRFTSYHLNVLNDWKQRD